jgi:hypothetical protein
VPKLAPGGTWTGTIDFGIHTGGEEVRRVAERVAAIQAERKTTLDDHPARRD